MIVSRKQRSSRPKKLDLSAKGGAGKSVLLELLSSTVFTKLRKHEIKLFDIDRNNPTLRRHLAMQDWRRRWIRARMTGRGPWA